MSNIHTVGSFPRSDDNSNNNNNYIRYSDAQAQQQPRYQQQQQQQQQQMFFLNSNDGGNDGISPYPPLNKVLAPNFNRYSFIFAVTVIQIIVFIIELIVGQTMEDGAFVKDNDMAGPSGTTLKDMRGKYLPCIKNGEIDRFIMPAFLHSGILHIFTNLVSQTMIGYTCEYHWGFWRMFGYYFGTTIGASLLSCVGSKCSVSVGASGALLGVIGAYMAWILLNWNNRAVLRNPSSRLCNMIWWLFIIFMVGISATSIDNYAHFGGWLSGMMIGFGFTNAQDPISWIAGKETIWRYVGVTLTVIYFITLLFSVFLSIDTSECQPC